MKPSRSKSKIIAVVLLAGVLPWLVSVATRFVFANIPHVNEPLHECLELVGSCIALGVATLLILRTSHGKSVSYVPWVAASLVAMGVVDAAHGVHGVRGISYL